MNIQNKVVIITGASSGIGYATSELLSKKGAKVALVARSGDKLKKLAKKLTDSIFVVADMTKKKDIVDMVKQVKKHFGRIDILINNAGQGYDAPIEQINIDTFHAIFDLNVVGPLIAMQQVIPLMRKQKEGAIINISSGTALMYLSRMSAYSSMKRALVGISLTAREELKKDNINVSVAYPTMTDTNFEKNTIRHSMEKDWPKDDGNFKMPKADTAEYVAEKILDGIENNKAEIFAHDWMGKRGK